MKSMICTLSHDIACVITFKLWSKFNKVITKSKHLEIQLYNKKTDLQIEYHLKQFASMI